MANFFVEPGLTFAEIRALCETAVNPDLVEVAALAGAGSKSAAQTTAETAEMIVRVTRGYSMGPLFSWNDAKNASFAP